MEGNGEDVWVTLSEAAEIAEVSVRKIAKDIERHSLSTREDPRDLRVRLVRLNDVKHIYGIV
jgi:hypothetical protein